MRSKSFIMLNLVVITFLIAGIAGYACASSDADHQGYQTYIASFMNSYNDNYILPSAVQSEMMDTTKTVPMDCGEISVVIREYLYDGVWFYVAAEVIPTDPTATLVLPGALNAESPVCGMQDDPVREDKRSFMEAAREDNKQLLAVYIYPKEFHGIGSYFLDYYQLDNDISVCLAGAELDGGNKDITITWQVEMYDVDVLSGQYKLYKVIEAQPQTISPLRKIEHYVYSVSDESIIPFKSVMMVKTALSTYVIPERSNEQNKYYYIRLYENGQRIPLGAPPEVNSFSLESIPKQLTIYVEGYGSAEIERIEDLNNISIADWSPW